MTAATETETAAAGTAPKPMANSWRSTTRRCGVTLRCSEGRSQGRDLNGANGSSPNTFAPGPLVDDGGDVWSPTSADTSGGDDDPDALESTAGGNMLSPGDTDARKPRSFKRLTAVLKRNSSHTAPRPARNPSIDLDSASDGKGHNSVAMGSSDYAQLPDAPSAVAAGAAAGHSAAVKVSAEPIPPMLPAATSSSSSSANVQMVRSGLQQNSGGGAAARGSPRSVASSSALGGGGAKGSPRSATRLVAGARGSPRSRPPGDADPPQVLVHGSSADQQPPSSNSTGTLRRRSMPVSPVEMQLELCREFLLSEQRYTARLHLLRELFCEPTRDVLSGLTVIRMFPELDNLCEWHEQLSSAFEQAVTKSPFRVGSVAMVLCDHTDFLANYRALGTRYSKAVELVTEQREQSAGFNELVEKQQQVLQQRLEQLFEHTMAGMHAEAAINTLEQLLETLVLRSGAYLTLAEQLQRYTARNDPDFPLLNQALLHLTQLSQGERAAPSRSRGNLAASPASDTGPSALVFYGWTLT